MFLVRLDGSDIVVLVIVVGMLLLSGVSAFLDWVCSKFKRRDRDDS